MKVLDVRCRKDRVVAVVAVVEAVTVVEAELRWRHCRDELAVHVLLPSSSVTQ